MSDRDFEIDSAGEAGASRRDGSSADRFYSTRIRQLARLDIDEAAAARLWRNVAQHRRALLNKLGRDVGQRVALLDYICNIEPTAGEPHIIERATLATIEQRAITDSLTKLQNRYFFELALERETQRSSRSGAQSSLLLLDLDSFKSINDRYGHRVGDEVLRCVGQIILQHMRGADVPCRYGGDEFAVILPDTPRSVALGVAERLCGSIAEWFAANKVFGNPLEVSASGGIASLPLDEASADLLFKQADGALYEAKHSGRGHVRAPLSVHQVLAPLTKGPGHPPTQVSL